MTNKGGSLITGKKKNCTWHLLGTFWAGLSVGIVLRPVRFFNVRIGSKVDDRSILELQISTICVL